MADASGRLTQITKNGWIQAGGKYYYIENGKLVTSKAYKINGSWYAFNYAGEMYVKYKMFIIVMKMAVRIIIVQKPMEACIALSGIKIQSKLVLLYENAKMDKRKHEDW